MVGWGNVRRLEGLVWRVKRELRCRVDTYDELLLLWELALV